jgi:Bacterial tandem repeat domain 1
VDRRLRTARASFFNVIFRPRSAKWAAVHSLTGAQYQAEYERRKRDGFRLRHVDTSTWRGEARYAAIFVQDGGAPVAAYHGRSAEEHQRLFEQWSSEGWRARNVSVVSLDGQRRYTALYEKGGPDVRLKSALTPAEYREEYERNREGSLHLAYVDAYVHQGRVFYSALWSRAGQGGIVARHGLTGAQYQEQWDDARRAGKLTRAVSGAEVDGRASYVAFWR